MSQKISSLAKPFELKSSSNPTLQIVLIHGFTASPTEVKPLGDYLYKKSDESFLIRSILLPGHGIDGEEGYKALDTVAFQDWIDDVNKKITSFSNKYSCPVIIIGLSMGALLTIQFLHYEFVRNDKIKASILLSPALFIKSPFFPLIKYIKYFKKYQFKGKDSEEFFKKYNLFSYTIRSLKASDEFRKLLNETKPLIESIACPILSYLAQEDELVDIEKSQILLSKNKNIKTVMLPNLDHIFTVYPESIGIFEEIYNWIENIIEINK